MANGAERDTGDGYVRRNVAITIAWLVAMLVGSLLLIEFGDALQAAFA